MDGIITPLLKSVSSFSKSAAIFTEVNLKRIQREELVEKCQENGWLKVGGFDWQDDPFLEE